MIKWLVRFLVFVFVLAAITLSYVYFQLRDRHPGYSANLRIDGNPAGSLRAGFAAVSITPPVPDPWTDANGDAQYDPADGDTYEDGNGNGRFDPVWMAGFQNKRPAMGVHDQLWARAIVIDDGTTRLALVALDAIGFLADDIIDIRKQLPEDLGVDYTIVCSTHTHEAPDLLGLWGGSQYKSGVDPVYLEKVKLQSVQAVEEAVAALRPARLRLAQDLEGAVPLVEDSRLPEVLDPGIRLLQAVDSEADTTLGVLFAWANHPETLWNENLLLSSDFPHFVRQGMEQGVGAGDSILVPGIGGVVVYVNGAIGGLMTTSPGFAIRDPFIDTAYQEPSFDKARAQGQQLALLGLTALRDTAVAELSEGAIRLRARTFDLPLYNPLYRLAAILGVIDRGTTAWMMMRSEVAFWQLGPASFLHQPGELYPEILNSGVEAPEGADFGVGPVETPALRELLPAGFQFTVGLSNDMIGYIIPKSEWDEEAPFIYDYKESPYGEINSVGPETGPLVYQALREIILDLSGNDETMKQ
jgi:hypothetical protein